MNPTFEHLLDETLSNAFRANALRGAFLWSDTQLGFDFWVGQHDRLLDGYKLSNVALDIIKNMQLISMLHHFGE